MSTAVSSVQFPASASTPEPVALKHTERGCISVPLPKMWIGMALASACLLFQLAGSDGYGLVLVTSMLGSCYWLFCIHRIHKVLSQYTSCAYPISPGKAVGFQFIPVYEYVWFFKWTSQIAKFIDAESAHESHQPKMSRIWPGALLAATSVFGLWPAFKSIRLFLIFGFGIFLTKKLKGFLPPPKLLCLRGWQRWNLSMSAGIGAAFSFVLVQAIRHFSAEQPREKLHDLAAIFLVSIGVLVFLEPVFERLRVVLGVSEHHPALHAHKPWLLRLSVFAILVLTSLFHGLLHSEIEGAIKTDSAGMVTMLLAALLVSGGVTYFWIGASHGQPPHAARSGLVSGTVLGFLVAFAVYVAISPPTASADSGQETVQQEVVHYAIPWAPSRVTSELSQGKFEGNATLLQLGVMTLPWAIFGLAGGIAIDRRWGNGKAERIVLSMLAPAFLCGIVLWKTGRVASMGEMLSHLSVVAGWGLALIACSSSKILIPAQAESGLSPLTDASATLRPIPVIVGEVGDSGGGAM